MKRPFLSFLTKIGGVAAIVTAFFISLGLTVYLSLSGPESRVPDIKGKIRSEAVAMLEKEGLNIRVRAARYNAGSTPDIILDQSPRAGAVVKSGVTVSVVVSRAPDESELKQIADSAPTPKEMSSSAVTSSTPRVITSTTIKINTSNNEEEEKKSASQGTGLSAETSPDAESSRDTEPSRDAEPSREKSDAPLNPALTERTEAVEKTKTEEDASESLNKRPISSDTEKSVEKESKERRKDEQQNVKP